MFKMNNDFYGKKYGIEISYLRFIPIDFNKLDNIIFKKKPEILENNLLIFSKINLKNNHCYRGIYNDYIFNDKIFNNDCSFMINSIFDNSYDFIFEFSFP